MDEANLEIIQSIYDELKKEQAGKIAALEEKKNGIKQIDLYLNGLLNKEESDLRVFLPRKVEDVYHDEIENREKQRAQLFSECDELEKRLHIIESRIAQFDKILADKEASMFYVKQFSILDVQEKERQRIARDLHDTSLQNLTHLIHKIELSSLYIEEDPVRAKLELATVSQSVRKIIDDIRNTIFDLRPMSVDDLGLKETVEKLLLVLNHDKKFRIITDIDETDNMYSDSLNYVLFISIYRIIQECVQNAIKHSEGNEIIVRLKNCDETYQILVKDNGIGFNIDEATKKDKHFGLSVIKERVLLLGGRINIETNARADAKMDVEEINAEKTNTGTSIEIVIPKTQLPG